MRWSSLLLLFIAVGVVAGATGGTVSFSGDTITVESVEDDTIILEHDSDSPLRYTENEPWNQTTSIVGSGTHETELSGVEQGDNATWRNSSVVASVNAGTARIAGTEETADKTSFYARTNAPIVLESDSRWSVTVGDGIWYLETWDSQLDDGGRDLAWQVTEDTNVFVPVDTNDTVRVVADGKVVGLYEGNGSVEVLARNNRTGVKLQTGSTTQLGNFTVDPVYTEARFTSPSTKTVSVDITNNAGTDSVNISENISWLSVTNTTTVTTGATTSVQMKINTNSTPVGYASEPVTLEADNETTQIWVAYDLESQPGSLTDTSFSLPIIGEIPTGITLLVMFTTLFIMTTVVWVYIDPKDNENLWL